MTTLVLGNRDAVHSRDNGETRETMKKGKRALTIIEPDGQSTAETFYNLTHVEGIWANNATGGATPAWVASDNELLAQLVAQHYGAPGKPLEIRQLETKGSGGASGVGGVLAPLLLVMYLAMLLVKSMPWLKTNAGNDVQAAQMSGSASATAVLKWVALTANATAPSATDTTLTAEITTAGGGLLRKIGTYAHTTGAASYTLTTTFTGNGSDSYPVTIAKRGIFDAASVGNMGFETLVVPTATLAASGDSVTLTDTISM